MSAASTDKMAAMIDIDAKHAALIEAVRDPSNIDVDVRIARAQAKWDADFAEYCKAHPNFERARQVMREEIVSPRLRGLLGFDGSDTPKPKQKRRRKPSIAAAIRQVRKAGERGPVRVSVTDPTGYTVAVSSGGDQDEKASGDAAVNPWDEVSKHAKH
jgi:hypothetical protein